MTTGDGLSISGGNFVVTKDGRQVVNTAGHHVMGVPTTVQSLTKTITYPDFSKAYWYNFQWQTSNLGGGGTEWRLQSFGAFWVSGLPQEWEQGTVVCAAATVADGTPLGFLGKIRLNRTKAPSHNVYSATLSMRVPANVWIPNCGSMLLEYVEFGVARTLTLMISGGNLILRQRQSIVNAALPYGWFGDDAVSTIPAGQSQQGGYWLPWSHDTNPQGGVGTSGDQYRGIPLYHDTTGDKALSANETLQTPSNNPGYWAACDFTSNSWIPADVPTFTDPTDYSSTYAVDIQGEFVRLT